MVEKSKDVITRFTTLPLHMGINFPEDEVCCWWCPLIRKDYLDRYRCGATDQILYNPRAIGLPIDCPVEVGANEEDLPE